MLVVVEVATMVLRYVIRKNTRAKVELHQFISGGRGTGMRLRREYYIYNKLFKDKIGPYFSRKEAERDYSKEVKDNLKYLKKKKKKKKR